MSQAPYAGARSATPGTSDFGATTVSGSPRSSQAPAGRDAMAPPDGGTAGVPPVPPPVGVGTSRAAGASATTGASRRGPRRAQLQVRHINPWTVLKFSCVLAVALFLVWLIVVGVLFGVLDAAGVISKINDTVTTINGPGSKAPITTGLVFAGAAIVGVVNVVLFIALSTIGSVVYNLCADLVGGVELTLSER